VFTSKIENLWFSHSCRFHQIFISQTLMKMNRTLMNDYTVSGISWTHKYSLVQFFSLPAASKDEESLESWRRVHLWLRRVPLFLFCLFISIKKKNLKINRELFCVLFDARSNNCYFPSWFFNWSRLFTWWDWLIDQRMLLPQGIAEVLCFLHHYLRTDHFFR